MYQGRGMARLAATAEVIADRYLQRRKGGRTEYEGRTDGKTEGRKDGRTDGRTDGGRAETGGDGEAREKGEGR